MYRDEIHVQPHDFSGTTTKIGTHILEGLESLKVEPMTERNTTGASADGFAWPVKSPDRRGDITITLPENSPSITVLWDLYEADESFPFSHVDPASPSMKVNNTAVRINRPPLERGADVTMVEFKMTALYLNYRGGGYSLVQSV